jgi:hypothetical protein
VPPPGGQPRRGPRRIRRPRACPSRAHLAGRTELGLPQLHRPRNSPTPTALIEKLHPLTGQPGLAAAVYTQTTDVEIEVNGLMTYDRAGYQDGRRDSIAAANQQLYTPPPETRAAGRSTDPPSTPLVAHDPYFSIWSPADRLTGRGHRPLDRRPHRLTSLIRIDGKHLPADGTQSARTCRRWSNRARGPAHAHDLHLQGGGVELTLTFMTAALPEDLDVLSRPVTYLVWDVQGRPTARPTRSTLLRCRRRTRRQRTSQEVQWSGDAGIPFRPSRSATTRQAVLVRKGDDVRIDWGYLYLAAPASLQP